MKLLVLNGPNLNMVGIREPAIYGNKTYKQLVSMLKRTAKEKGVALSVKQSNYEGKIVTLIQKAYKKYDGIIINPGAFTHTSIAILDALKAVDIRTVEVHLSDVSKREDYRQISYVREFAEKTIAGKGFDGYIDAIDYFLEK